MTATVYYVVLHDQVLHDQEWTIRLRDRHYAPYGAQREAIKDAIDAAYQLGKTDPDGAQVLAQVEGDRFHLEWIYGAAPYPPPD